MSDAFNPYLEWLGLPNGARPTNYYELLGIDCCEGDPAVIARAADGLTSRVRSIRPGPRLAEWQRLLDELTRAKASLANPIAKAAYDAALRNQPTPIPTASARFLPPPGLEAPRAEAPSQPWIVRQPSAGSPVAATSRIPLVIAWSSMIVLVVAIAGFAAMLYQQQRQQPPSRSTATVPNFVPHTTPRQGNGSKASLDAKPHSKAGDDWEKGKPPLDKAAKTEGPATRAGQPRPQAANSPEEKSPAGNTKGAGPDGPDAASQAATGQAANLTEDPAKREALKRELGEARAALAERNFTSAREHLKAARPQAQTSAEQAKVARLETLLNDVQEFWKGMSKILASLQPTEEFSIGGAMMIVVSADANAVTFRSEGRNQTYPLRQLPHEIVVTLARSRLAKGPSSKALLGAYLAVDPEGDPAAARRLWEEATREGVDMSEMMPELDVATGPGTAGNRIAPPTDPAKLQQAEQAVKERFKSEYEGATTALRKADLAKRLLERGRTTNDNPELRFAMLREARDLAVASGKPVLACLAIDQLARFYTIDDLAMKTAALDETAKGVRGVQGFKEVAEQALKVIEQAAAAKRVDEAKRLLPSAFAAAQKSRSLLLVRRVQAVGRQLGAVEPTPGGDKPEE